MDLETIISKIMEAKSLGREEVEKLINDKQAELSFLVSPEGAAYLVAKDLDVEIPEMGSKRLMIKNIISGMRNVQFIGKIVRISDIVEFDKKDGKGRVRNVFLADETGRIRLTLWDDEVEIVESLSEGDVVRISGYSRDNQGRTEIRLGKYGSVQKVDDKIDVSVDSNPQKIERKFISDLSEFDRAEIKAAIVQVFQTNPILHYCPKCGKIARNEDGKFVCKEHGEIDPTPGLVVSFVADDGTGNIRCVAFGNSAERIIGMTPDKAVEEARDKMDKTAPLRNVESGKEFIFSGRVRKNEMFGRLEFRIFGVREVNVDKEIEYLLGEINGK